MVSCASSPTAPSPPSARSPATAPLTDDTPHALLGVDAGAPIFLDRHPGAHKANEPVVANVSDGGIDRLSANTNARLDTKAVKKWIKETIREVLGEEHYAED
jgi:hypothetical protein